LQDDVTSLNQVLQGNQTRGAYGELQLSMLLENTFPTAKANTITFKTILASPRAMRKFGPMPI
jgi:DNA anti-recombination protein RmuC